MTAPATKSVPMILAWAGLTIAAFVLAGFAPAWVAALCVPLAGLVTWLLTRRRRNVERLRLEQLAGQISTIGLDPADTTDADPAGTEPLVTHARTRTDPASDLTDLIARCGRRVESAMLRHTRDRAALRALLNAVDTPVIATDATGHIASMNRAAERLFDGPNRAAGAPLEELFTNNALLEMHARAARGEACRQRVRLMLDGQARFHEVSAIPVRLSIADIPARVPQRAGVVLTLRDVHELARTLQLRTDFAANASHELRTPIAAIRAAIETLAGPAAEDTAMQQRLTGMIENNTARLEELVEDLLDLSRLETEEAPIRAETFRSTELAEPLASMLSDKAKARGVSLVIDFDPTIQTLRTDRKLVLLILRNLVDNAIRFAFDNTQVRVTGEAIPNGNGSLAGTRFRVADRGTGIPLKHQERIFERFFQVDESRARVGGRRGSGLGLAIVRHALRRLNGTIRVDSVWREGTTMTVEIPRSVLFSKSDDAVEPPLRN